MVEGVQQGPVLVGTFFTHMGAPHALHELKIYLPLPGGDLLFEVLLQLG